MSVCRATKANGEPCTLSAQGQHGYCWAHDPANTAKRKEVATRGGKGKAARRTNALWEEVRRVIAGVEEGRITPPQGNTVLKAYGVLITLEKLSIEQSELEITQRRLELDVEERTVLKERMAALEEHAQRTRTWGA